MFKDIKVVLVGTLYDRNIGSTSRVMANMGISDLILVKPQCSISFEAQLAAATGQEALQSRTVYSDWPEFFAHEKEGLRIAFTARDGRGRLTDNWIRYLKNISTQLTDVSSGNLSRIYLIFGPEDAGLSIGDIKHVHGCVRLNTYGKNSSLNLSHAVLLALFSLNEYLNREPIEAEKSPASLPTDDSKIQLIEPILTDWLLALGLSLDKQKTNALTVLYRMILRSVPTEKEYEILTTMLQQTIRKLKSK